MVIGLWPVHVVVMFRTIAMYVFFSIMAACVYCHHGTLDCFLPNLLFYNSLRTKKLLLTMSATVMTWSASQDQAAWGCIEDACNFGAADSTSALACCSSNWQHTRGYGLWSRSAFGSNF